ncbi:MAG: PAS domain S-box protein [Planctomycetes bacterium]|nr:PAS domain S-box protein [Planctomycetota bacterium]
MSEVEAGMVEMRLRAAIDASQSGLLMIDAEGRVVLANREVERLFQYSREELLGKPVELLLPEAQRELHVSERSAFCAHPRMRTMGMGRDLHGRRKDGMEVPVEIGLSPVVTTEGLFVVASIVDVAPRRVAEKERARLEDQLRHLQKMEAIGTLAGGIAHDFNNILSAIVGYAEFIRDELPTGSAPRRDVDVLLQAADRGRQLVKRILTFSRRQETVRMPVDLGMVIRDATNLLRATLPASIQMRLTSEPNAPRVLADPTSLHQVVMNLATNAAHAMTDGGSLDISIEPFYVRDSFARARPQLHEGPYGILTVRDTGHGMEKAIADRAFEPFFTTKDPGSGTGLGLSTVLAIMRDHDGMVELESEVGKGTTVKCFFPAVEATTAEDAETASSLPRGNGERVLLVDDEVDLARLGGRRLRLLGYEPTCVEDPVDAVRRFEADPQAFDLLVTDYLMPKVSGIELCRRVLALRPDLPILMTSGCIDQLSADDLRRIGNIRLLGKPVAQSVLAETLRAMLHER